MKYLILTSTCLFVLVTGFSQGQVRIEGASSSVDTVTRVVVNYSGNTSVVALAVHSHPAEDLGIAGYFNGGEVGLLSECFNNEAIIGVSTNSIGVFGQSEGASGTGVFGLNNTLSGNPKGVHGKAIAGGGIGVLGEHPAVTGLGYGVQGTSASDQGVAIYGHATSASGLTTGAFGRADSEVGRGVYGNATSTTGNAWGVFGRSASSSGRGVYGTAVSASGTAYGVYGSSNSTSGIGVYGTALSATGTVFGVKGETMSPSGIGMFGINNATSGSARGVHGSSAGDIGIGVYGIATHTSGVTYGLYGTVLSPSGYAGYFDGTAYIHNGGEYDRGLRVHMNPTAGSALEGAFVNVSGASDNNYGGRFIVTNSAGSNYGVSSVVNKHDGTGVSRAMFAENVSSAGGSRFGVQTEISGDAASTMYGVHSAITGNSGSAAAYGVYTYIGNGATTGSNYALYAANFNDGHSARLVGKTWITGGDDAGYNSHGYLQLGTTSAANVVFDDNEILARDNGLASDLHMQRDGGNLLLCELELGAVGIGIADAANLPSGYLLAVDGKGIMEELRVELSGAWPDYVFEDDYALPELDELDQFIKTHGHLPNIPSAKEVHANGLHVGEMQRRMMEKIEELTLYIVQLKKEIDDLKSRETK